MNNKELYKYVVQNSQYVKINTAAIPELIEKIKGIDYCHWASGLKKIFGEKEIIKLVLICESINFCFWNCEWTKKYNGKTFKGSMALFYTIIDEAQKNKSFLSIEYLKSLSLEEFKKKFTDSNNNTISMLNERYANLKQVIEVLDRKENYLFSELYAIKSSEKLLEYILANFKCFEDYGLYKGKIIYFNKRANLLVNDLYQVSEIIKKNINNIRNLGGCADYQVPNLLRNNDILVYNDELSQIIDNNEIIECNSIYEIEIRANMLYVIEVMSEMTNIPAIILDNILWNYNKLQHNRFFHHKCINTRY